MKYTIERVHDTEEMRKLHKLAFGSDKWPGDDHEFWVAKDEGGAIAGFCSAVLLTASCAFFSRSAVTQGHRGKGLHKKLIQVRMRWAKKEGAVLVLTYLSKHNYPSLINLLKSGFKFAPKELWPAGYSDCHIMWSGCDQPDMLKYSLGKMDEEVERPTRRG